MRSATLLFLLSLILSLAVCSPREKPAPVQSQAATETSPPDTTAVLLKVSKDGEPDEFLRLLPPAAFPELPENVSAWLRDNGYLIPQHPDSARPHNVKSGEFIQRGQKDWAVLALKDSVISIIVFWNEHGQDKRAVLNKKYCRDGFYFIIYAGSLETVTAYGLQKYVEWHDSLPPETVVEHSAIGKIDDSCFYYYKGDWYEGSKYGFDYRDVQKEGIKHLPASAFPQLPADIARWLDENGYTIPQSFVSRSPHNVVVGEFVKPGQTDWAVLASKDDISSVIIFWNTSANDIEVLSPRPDSIFCRNIELGTFTFAYCRIIKKEDDDFKTYYKDFEYIWKDDQLPPGICHDALYDSFSKYESAVYYWHEGKLHVAYWGD